MTPPGEDDAERIHCRLDELLEARGMTLAELSRRVGISVVNLSVLKNDRARAIRFCRSMARGRSSVVISPSRTITRPSMTV